MIEDLEQLKQLLAYEKEHELELFRNQLKKITLKERQRRGYSWSNLQISGEGFAIGEHAYLILKRQKELSRNHQFKAGAPVQVYPKGSPSEVLNGTIHFVDRDKMKVILSQKYIPDFDWKKQAPFAVDLLFDERTYREMDRAVDRLSKAKDDRLAFFRDIFFKNKTNSFDERSKVEIANLNPSQNDAIADILASQDLSIIHGPPGTGKTTTLVQAVKLLLQKEKQVLVCAPSNSAVDLLAERLAAKKLRVVRLGNISRLDESVLSLSLDHQVDQDPESKQIKKIRIEADAARREAQKWKRNFSQEQRRSRKDLYRESRELLDWAKHLEERLVRNVLQNAQVVACTLVNAYHHMLRDFQFSTVCIDEAGQALEPATWIAISKGDKVVLAGDPHQLPPTVKSRKALNSGLGASLLERCLKQGHHMSFLDTQYRMNEAIMNFSNRKFYNGALKADESVANWKLDWDPNEALTFIDTAGCDFEEQVNSETGSRYNPNEWYILRELFYAWRKQTEEFPTMGIISPYRAQCQFIEREITNDDQLNELPNLTINTIDAFQGQERDLIVISLVRSNEKGEIGFLSDYRRMNVALTRAKKQLIVIGDSATIGADSFYNDFLKHVEEHGVYRSAWEWIS